LKIFIPVDFSAKFNSKLLELALSLNQNQKSTIILVHIVELIYDFASQACYAFRFNALLMEEVYLDESRGRKYHRTL